MFLTKPPVKNVDICIELCLVCIAVVLGVVGGDGDGEYVNTIVSFILSNAIRLCCDTRGLSWTGAFPHTDTSASHRNISIMPSVPQRAPVFLETQTLSQV